MEPEKNGSTEFKKGYELVATSPPDEHESAPAKQEGQLSKKTKYFTAATIFYGNIALGVGACCIAPSLTSYQRKYDTTDSTISKVFLINTLCFMVMALAAGYIFSKVNRQFVVILALALMGLAMILLPFAPTLPLFFVTAALFESGACLYDMAQFIWIPEMMGKDCPPYVQAQHFFFAVGANLAGFIVAPFLAEGEERSNLVPPFAIIGSLLLIASIGQLVLYRMYRYHPPPPEVVEVGSVSEEDKDGGASGTGKWPWPKLRLVILMCSFFAAYLGVEVSTFKFFPKFVQNSELRLPEKTAAYVFSGMTTAFAVGRGVGIFVVLKVPPRLVLWADIGVLLIANVLLVGWAHSSLPVLWAASILLGLGLSMPVALFVAFMERFLALSNFMGSLILVSGSVATLLYQWIVGSFIEQKPLVLIYKSFVSIGLASGIFAFLCYITYKNKTRYT